MSKDLISSSLLEEEVEMLACMPSVEEIKDAVFSLGSHKALGPDGMLVHFYKCYWNVIRGEIVEVVSSFFSKGYILKEINRTFIALIPKGSNVASVNQFRPIILCNVLYKIISKLLVNRLKGFAQIDLPLVNSLYPWKENSRKHFLGSRNYP